MKLGHDDLIELLQEQLGFIDASCMAFDQGRTPEAKRLATSVRVLVHDTGMSRSLLGQLGIKDSLRWLDLMPIHFQDVPFPNVEPMSISENGFGYALAGIGEDYFAWVPAFRTPDESEPASSTFDPWWKTPHMAAQNGQRFSRRNFVLMLANKEGGAHVDDAPDSRAQLVRGGSMGWSTAAGPVTESPAPAAARHIAEEVRRSIRASHPDLLGDLRENPPDNFDPASLPPMMMGGMQLIVEHPEQ